MKLRLVAFVFGCFLSGAVWAAPDSCRMPGHSGDPSELAKALLPEIERLEAAIPSLSPREEEWLKGELNQKDLRRSLRATDSREHVMRVAKWNAGSLLGSLRVLTKAVTPRVQERQVDQWAFFVYTLIEDDAGVHLARLERDGVIKSDSLPQFWTMIGKTGAPLADSIRMFRSMLARHILICILPKVAD